MRPQEDEVESRRGIPDLIQDPLGIARRRWVWVLSALLPCLLASGAYFHALEPRYYSEATVMITRQQVAERVVSPTIEEDALTRIDAMAAEMLATTRLQQVIEDHDLHAELRESATMADVVARVRKDVKIEAVRGVGPRSPNDSAQVFVIGFTADQPQVAADVANSLANLFIEASLESQHRQHRLTTAFLQRELDGAEQALREQNRRIAEFKRQHRGQLPDELDTNLAKLDLLQQQRQSLALQIAEAEARVVTLAAEEDTSPTARLADLHAKVRVERSRLTERHPNVAALQREIAALEREVAETGDLSGTTSPGALRLAAERTLVVLRSQLAATEKELEAIDFQVEQTPAVQEELTALQEKETILRESYLAFLRKVQDSELAENLLLAQQGERVSVVNRAMPSSVPSRSGWKWLLAGVVLSFGVACVVGVVAEALDPVLVTAGQIEAGGGPPVLGSVGRIR